MIELLSIDLSNYCSKQCLFCYNHSTREGNTLWKPQEVIDFGLRNFNCVKALILYILPHLTDTIFNRAGQMRNLSSEAKLHDFKTFSKFYC